MVECVHLWAGLDDMRFLHLLLLLISLRKHVFDFLLLLRRGVAHF
jgi:hypothetical protein